MARQQLALLPYCGSQHAESQQPLEQQRQSLLPSPDLRPTPPSRSSTGSSRKSTLSLDLSSVPPYVPPTPPSNTLIFTNLQSRDIFHAENLQTIRDLISKTAPIHSWSPLKSFRRIIVSFFDESAAIAVRQIWDGEAIFGERCRVYFGQPTPITAQHPVHLALPDAGKLFFISPPPSPPHGWEVRMEDAPNKMVHAEDLAEALARLRHHNEAAQAHSPVSPANESGGFKQRSRSSTLIFQPNVDELPCVTVDDLTDEPEEISPVAADAPPKPIMAHTARPPVELMMDS
ncbi:Calcipressin-domain-containing protein [Canariomyces notabilis]|uniref:Calcipressin-domain-containing protein n=1 Tax=Canariomyces notabilis TaxID=2074819 RepID=A0AAN6YVN8_9PEZI|nr:Calcipressin-domain-containing protein [Canariomyces arenarius]